MQGHGHDESPPTSCGVSLGVSWCVRSIIGSPSAAVGTDLSCPHICKQPQNGNKHTQI